MDDVTLGEMLTAAHRGQVDYCVPGGMSVSQSSSSVMFDGSGQPDGERMVDHSRKSGVTFNMISAHSNFSEGPYLVSKDRHFSRSIAKKSVITNSKQLTQKKSADSYKDNYGDRNWHFVNLTKKDLEKWKNY